LNPKLEFSGESIGNGGFCGQLMPKQNHMKDILETFKRNADRESLKSSVGRAIFCPRCEELMDYRRAVEFSVWENETGKCATVRAMCAPCWDGVRELVTKPGVKYRVDVIDGRKLK
jgi:hypothetical protein